MAIKSCTCKNEYMDKKYGMFKRVWNYCAKAPIGQGGWRCASCGKEESK